VEQSLPLHLQAAAAAALNPVLQTFSNYPKMHLCRSVRCCSALWAN